MLGDDIVVSVSVSRANAPAVVAALRAVRLPVGVVAGDPNWATIWTRVPLALLACPQLTVDDANLAVYNLTRGGVISWGAAEAILCLLHRARIRLPFTMDFRLPEEET